MNRLANEFNRGFSLKNDDLRWIDNSIREALSDICKGLGIEADAFVIWGAEISLSGTTATVTEGAIYYLGEVWHVSPHTFTVLDPLPAPPSWCFTATYDAAGVKLDKDLASHNAYEKRTVVGWMVGADPTGVLFTEEMGSFPRLRELIQKSTTGALVSYPQSPTQGTVTIRKTNGVITILGDLVQTVSPGIPIHLFTVPSGYRAGFKIAGLLSSELTSDGAVKVLEWYITNDGKFCAEPHAAEISTIVEVKMYFQITYHV